MQQIKTIQFGARHFRQTEDKPGNGIGLCISVKCYDKHCNRGRQQLNPSSTISNAHYRMSEFLLRIKSPVNCSVPICTILRKPAGINLPVDSSHQKSTKNEPS